MVDLGGHAYSFGKTGLILSMKIFIYILKDQYSDEVRYVGKTYNPKQRLCVHINEAKSRKSKRHVLHWISGLLDKGRLPYLQIIEECTYHEWQEREIYWISFYRKQGHRLCNHSEGGAGTRGTACRVYESEKERNEVYKKIQNNLPFKYDNEKRRRMKPIILSASSHKECQKQLSQIKRNTYYEVRSGKIWKEI